MSEKKNNNKKKALEEQSDDEDKSLSEEETQEIPDEEVSKLGSLLKDLTHNEPKTPERPKPEPYVFSPSRGSPYSTGKEKADERKVNKIKERQWPTQISLCKHLWVFSFDCQPNEKIPNLYTKVKKHLVIQNGWFDLGNSSYLNWTDEGNYVPVRNQVIDSLLRSQESQRITYVTFIRACPFPTQNWSGNFVTELKNALLQIPGADILAINQINDTHGAPNAQ